MILVVVDAGSKYKDAHNMNSATSAASFEKLRHTFALFGLPRTIVSDNGTPFTSELFSEFCSRKGVKHVGVPPYHPASNGMAERAVQTVKLGLKKITEGSLETRLYRFLLSYHKMPQSTINTALSELLMKRQLRSCIDLVKPDTEDVVLSKQEKMKMHHDRHSKERMFLVGDPIYAYNFLGKPKCLSGVLEEKLGIC